MRTRVRWLAAAAAGVMAAAVALTMGPANAESNGGVRVMPLGDSITYGWGDGNPDPNPGGYRIGLWQRLVAGGYQTDFVGSQFNGPAGLGDHDHEGHGGWRIDQIDANIVGWLRTYQPHTVLLHIGTNDIAQNRDLANAPNRLSALIDHITTTAPSAEVFVAQIIPYGFPSTALDKFNAAIPGIVQSKVAAGKHVHLVDMYHALTAADLSSDRVHPNRTGYDKMAATWYQALLSVPGSIGTPGGGTPSSAPPSSVPPSTPPSGTSGPVHALGAGKCLDVPNASQANNTQLAIWDCGGGSNQRWTYTSGKQLTVYGTKCLDASGHGRSNGTPVIIWDCGGGTNQQWNVNANGTVTGVESGLCLDVTGGSTANGALVQLWTCNGNSQQQWRLG